MQPPWHRSVTSVTLLSSSASFPSSKHCPLASSSSVATATGAVLAVSGGTSRGAESNQHSGPEPRTLEQQQKVEGFLRPASAPLAAHYTS